MNTTPNKGEVLGSPLEQLEALRLAVKLHTDFLYIRACLEARDHKQEREFRAAYESAYNLLYGMLGEQKAMLEAPAVQEPQPAPLSPITAWPIVREFISYGNSAPRSEDSALQTPSARADLDPFGDYTLTTPAQVTSAIFNGNIFIAVNDGRRLNEIYDILETVSEEGPVPLTRICLVFGPGVGDCQHTVAVPTVSRKLTQLCIVADPRSKVSITVKGVSSVKRLFVSKCCVEFPHLEKAGYVNLDEASMAAPSLQKVKGLMVTKGYSEDYPMSFPRLRSIGTLVLKKLHADIHFGGLRKLRAAYLQGVFDSQVYFPSLEEAYGVECGAPTDPCWSVSISAAPGDNPSALVLRSTYRTMYCWGFLTELRARSSAGEGSVRYFKPCGITYDEAGSSWVAVAEHLESLGFAPPDCVSKSS